MIYSLSGNFHDLRATFVLVRCYGVGYGVNIPLSTYNDIKDMVSGTLFIRQVFREDSVTLYGFSDEDQRRMFEMLTGVTGVGGTTALLILSSMTVGDLAQCIAAGQESVLVKIKGIGAKTAKQIILDLKDKVGKIIDGPVVGVDGRDTSEVVAGLVGLGFTKAVATKAAGEVMKAYEGPVDVGAVLKLCLKQLS